MVRDVRSVPIRYGGLKKLVRLPGWYCPKCAEGIHTRKDMEVSDKALREMMDEIDMQPRKTGT